MNVTEYFCMDPSGVTNHYWPREKEILLHARDLDDQCAGVIVAKTGSRRIGVAVYKEWMDVPISWVAASLSHDAAQELYENLRAALDDWPGEGPE